MKITCICGNEIELNRNIYSETDTYDKEKLALSTYISNTQSFTIIELTCKNCGNFRNILSEA